MSLCAPNLPQVVTQAVRLRFDGSRTAVGIAHKCVEDVTEMPDDTIDIYRRAMSDYRLALGLDLRARRDVARCSLPELSTRTSIPVETLRHYEKGLSLPQIMRLADIGAAYEVSALDILISTARYIYRASGEPIPDVNVVPADRIALRAVILYCGVTPDQLRLVESHPLQRQ